MVCRRSRAVYRDDLLGFVLAYPPLAKYKGVVCLTRLGVAQVFLQDKRAG
jgi:hypothetical protein